MRIAFDFLSMNAICVAKINISHRLYWNCYAFAVAFALVFALQKSVKTDKNGTMEMSPFTQLSDFVSAFIVHSNCGN